MSADGPFMSFLVPAAGQRPESLDETLLSLSAQTDTDFEVIVLADTSAIEVDRVREGLAEHPATLRERTTLVVASGTPAEVLDAGVQAARGSYVALSDHVTWLGHWVEEARAAARHLPGRCIRGLVLEQAVETVLVGGVPGLRATGAPVRAGGRSFSVQEHLAAPWASTFAHAFPRSVFDELGVRFEDTYGTALRRHHLLRAIELAGVVEIDDIVAVHQVHGAVGQQESPDDLTAMLEAVSARPFLLPPGWVTGALAQHHGASAALDTAREEVDRLTHLITLKDGHIDNLERMLAERDERLDRVQEKLAKRTEQVERLRAKLAERSGRESSDPDAADPDADSSGRGRWFKGRS